VDCRPSFRYAPERPTTGKGGLPVIQCVANSLISSDFADFTAFTGIYWIAFGFPCSSFKVTHELQGPQAERSATPIPYDSLPSQTFDARSQR
jgi:hypothetical protein